MIQEVKTPVTSDMEYKREKLRLEVQNSVSTYKPDFSKDKAEKDKLKSAKASYMGGLEAHYGRNFMLNPVTKKQFKSWGLNRPDIKNFLR